MAVTVKSMTSSRESSTRPSRRLRTSSRLRIGRRVEDQPVARAGRRIKRPTSGPESLRTFLT